jgi:hypothetical protein
MCRVGAAQVRANRWTGGEMDVTELTGAFHGYMNMPKNMMPANVRVL